MSANAQTNRLAGSTRRPLLTGFFINKKNTSERGIPEVELSNNSSANALGYKSCAD
jgi:hypothetical protein